jgi:cold shock CspA family protein
VRGTTFDDLLEGQAVEFIAIERSGGKGNGLAAEAVTVKDNASAAA